MKEQTVYFIEGDGIGQEVSTAARIVLDSAVEKAYKGSKKLIWKELLAGEKALKEKGTHLPEETLAALAGAEVALKGPLTTPVGTGIRSLNVTLRQAFDLYACIRPIRYYEGVASPVKAPEKINMVIFRENVEDVYMGIEWASCTPEAKKLITFIKEELGKEISMEAAIGLKPMTPKGSTRLIKSAIEYALRENRRSVTLVHKGNIMKCTEGAFRNLGYELAEKSYASEIMTEKEAQSGMSKKLLLNDRIADAMFQEALIYPEKYDVLATSNLNGDYLSDALAAQVGGLGLAPGVNMGEKLAIFEATHGTAPNMVGKDMANPCSIILSGAMLLKHVDMPDAGELIEKAVEQAITNKTVTHDLASQMKDAKSLSCSDFTKVLQDLL